MDPHCVREIRHARRIMKSDPARCANPGARILHLYGRLVPSLEHAAVSARKHGRRLGYARNKVDTHLALRRLDRAVGLTWRHGIPFAENLRENEVCGTAGRRRTNLEVVDETLHALLHRGARRRYKLMVVHLDCTRRHFVQALFAQQSTIYFCIVSNVNVGGGVHIETKPVIHNERSTHLVDNPQALSEFLHAT